SIPVLIKMSKLFNASCDYILGVSDVRTVMNGISSDSDIEIVSEFNSLTPMEQNMVRAYMQALRDKK
ncbi:MAG: XRE family transcriptional regulator, partial [Ruminococcus sp.]|nr:XRE family transcriptional regulator [Ruminococcus sp.]